MEGKGIGAEDSAWCCPFLTRRAPDGALILYWP